MSRDVHPIRALHARPPEGGLYRVCGVAALLVACQGPTGADTDAPSVEVTDRWPAPGATLASPWHGARARAMGASLALEQAGVPVPGASFTEGDLQVFVPDAPLHGDTDYDGVVTVDGVEVDRWSFRTFPLESRRLGTAAEVASAAHDGLVPADTSSWTPPTAAEGAAFADVLERVLAGDLDVDAPLADLGYGLATAHDDRWSLAIVEESPRWGTVLLDFTAETPLIVGAPHTGYETDTWAEAVEVYDGLRAWALVVNGAHRCASEVPSGCDGTTSVCGASAPYVESDAAHDPDLVYHVAHAVLLDHDPAAVAISLHGFGWADGDPEAFVSDGTEAAADADALVSRFAAALEERLPDGAFVASCNDPADEVRLCGTTNVQGRHANGVADVCTVGAEAASGRFLHLEQSRALRGATGDVHRGLVVDALGDVLR